MIELYFYGVLINLVWVLALYKSETRNINSILEKNLKKIRMFHVPHEGWKHYSSWYAPRSNKMSTFLKCIFFALCSWISLFFAISTFLQSCINFFQEQKLTPVLNEFHRNLSFRNLSKSEILEKKSVLRKRYSDLDFYNQNNRQVDLEYSESHCSVELVIHPLFYLTVPGRELLNADSKIYYGCLSMRTTYDPDYLTLQGYQLSEFAMYIFHINPESQKITLFAKDSSIERNGKNYVFLNNSKVDEELIKQFIIESGHKNDYLEKEKNRLADSCEWVETDNKFIRHLIFSRYPKLIDTAEIVGALISEIKNHRKNSSFDQRDMENLLNIISNYRYNPIDSEDKRRRIKSLINKELSGYEI